MTIIRSKIMIQKLWVKGVTWDQMLPEGTINEWQTLRQDLFNLNSIEIKRWISHHNNDIELHGFSDASMHAYAASVYARIRQPDGQDIITLLTAKTRVAPLKQIPIPRLELCGAVLLAELLKKIQNELSTSNNNIHAWTIVIHWLRAEPRNWKTFIANRVSTIQQLIPIACWHHVPTADNPSDCASRGIDAVSLKNLKLG